MNQGGHRVQGPGSMPLFVPGSVQNLMLDRVHSKIHVNIYRLFWQWIVDGIAGKIGKPEVKQVVNSKRFGFKSEG